MSLRKQLLALGALILLLPWAGFRFLQETEESFRTNHEQLLLAVAATVAREISGSDDLVRQPFPAPGLAEPIYAYPLTGQPPRLDGYRTDWRFAHSVPDATDDDRAIRLADGSRLWLGIQAPYLFLYIEVADDDIVLQSTPGRPPHGDRVALLYGNNARTPRALLLATTQPGNLRAQLTPGADRFESTGEVDDNVPGFWRNIEGRGYAIEARLPLSQVDGALGVEIIDTDADGTSVQVAAATWGATPAPNALVREWPELTQILRPFEDGDDRWRVLDADGRVLADSGPLELSAAAAANPDRSLTERFFRYALKRQDPPYRELEGRPGQIADPRLLAAIGGAGATAWFGLGGESSAVVAAAVPIHNDDERLGAVLLEQASDPILSLRNPATLLLVSMTVLGSLIAAAALLAYASFLSFRIGRLARAAESALGPRGEIRVGLPGTRARDEIGGLSRSFEDLLGRLRDYTDYLQSLKSKLSHELRTPLAIVATSLDNLEHELDTDSGRAYLDRLRHGALRLESILQAMTAATRVEQAITQTVSERFDLRAVVASCVAAYGDVYPGRSFTAQLPDGPVPVEGSAELIEQLLDKLIDNAASFAAAGSTIEISLDADADEARLAVVNRGPLLPESMRHQLFDSLVSVRAQSSDRPHLGLGLYIVTLITEFHRGQVGAENLADRSGVRFTVVLPRADARSA